MSDTHDNSVRLPALLLVVAAVAVHMAAAANDNLVDPTRPAGWAAPAVTEDESAAADEPLILQGVFNAAGRQSAVISGRRVAVGDEVAGAELIEIEKGRVVLRRDGETVELVSPLPTVKTLATTKKTVGRHATGDVARLLK